MSSSCNDLVGDRNSTPANLPPQDSAPPQLPDCCQSEPGGDRILNDQDQPVMAWLAARLENLPLYLKEHGMFCYWRSENRPGSDKPAKVPYSPRTGRRLDVNRRDDFGTYDDVLDYAVRGFDGVGICITDKISAADIDHCIGPGGQLSDMAQDICRMMQSYTEISPSRQGIRIVFLATGFEYDKSKYYINCQKLGLEVYVSGSTSKYVSITGHALFPGRNLEECGPELLAVLDKYMVRPVQAVPSVQAAPQGSTPMLDDETVIRLASRAMHGETFEALMAGDTSEYDYDSSRADLALCSQLAFFTAKNIAQMDRLFRASGLMRPKWDERRGDSTYGWLTIQKAIVTQKTVYGRTLSVPSYTVLPNSQSVNQPPVV